VIPTCNRPAELARCLASIETVRRPGPIEVVVVDDGSATPLDAVVAPFRGTVGATLVRQANRGPGAARNTGVVHAAGRYVVFTDDDCRFEEGALETFVAALQEKPGAIVGGRTRNGLPKNQFAAASQVIVDAVYAYYNRNPADARFFATNNMAVERSAFLASDGFDELFSGAAEDRDFCDRWRHRGGRLVYEPGAIVVHAHDLTFRGYVRQHRAYGRGAYTYHRLRARRGSGRLRDDLGFHVDLARRLATGARHVPPGTALRGVVLAAVWQVANAFGWAEAATSDGTRRIARQVSRRSSEPV
jgi:GT2 family glycosyltransferase